MADNLGSRLQAVAAALASGESGAYVPALWEFCTEDVVSLLMSRVSAEQDTWRASEFIILAFGCLKILCRERLGTEQLHTEDGFRFILDHSLQFMRDSPANNEVADAALKVLLNSIFRNEPMLQLLHKLDGARLLVAAVSSPGFSAVPCSTQRQLLQILYVFLALHPPALTAARAARAIAVCVSELTRYLQSDLRKEEGILDIPEGLAAVLGEHLKILFLLTNKRWNENPDFSGPAQLAVLATSEIVQEFLTVVPIVRLLLRTCTEKHTKLCLHAVELLVNTPPCASRLLLRADAAAMELAMQGARSRPAVHPAVITERHWDPDRPGEETVTVLAGGGSASARDGGSGGSGSGGGGSSGEQMDEPTERLAVVYSDVELAICGHLLQLLNLLLVTEEDIAEVVTPVFAVLRILALDNPQARRKLKKTVFTRRTDLSVGPEVGDCLRARLVRLMTSPNAQLKIMSADFLWVICNQNAGRLVKYVGYGHAAGFLTDSGMMGMPSPVVDSDSSSAEEQQGAEEEKASGESVDLNPVTAREWSEPHVPVFVSEEHREHVAHELLGLIDRLNRTGVMRVDLPPPQTPPQTPPSSGEESSP